MARKPVGLETPTETETPKESAVPETEHAETVSAASSASVSKKSSRKEVRAKIVFADALTGRNFKAGDIVEGWDDERVEEYAKRGLVYVAYAVGPTEFK